MNPIRFLSTIDGSVWSVDPERARVIVVTEQGRDGRSRPVPVEIRWSSSRPYPSRGEVLSVPVVVSVWRATDGGLRYTVFLDDRAGGDRTDAKKR